MPTLQQPDRVAPRPAVFLDRDGVINIDRGYVFRPTDLAFTPTAIAGIARFNAAGYRVIVVTNQSGVARGYYAAADVERFHDVMAARVREGGGRIDAFYYSPHHPDGTVAPYACEHPDRKPNPGMILRAMAEWPVDRTRAILFGDKASDIEAAARAGIQGRRLASDTCDLDAAIVSWLDGPDMLP